MQLELHNQKLEKLLNNQNKLVRKIGLEMSRMIKRRFNGFVYNNLKGTIKNIEEE